MSIRNCETKDFVKKEKSRTKPKLNFIRIDSVRQKSRFFIRTSKKLNNYRNLHTFSLYNSFNLLIRDRSSSTFVVSLNDPKRTSTPTRWLPLTSSNFLQSHTSNLVCKSSDRTLSFNWFHW